MTSSMEISYRDILKQNFQDRSLVNPSYSMRSFARDLAIAPSSLSEVLNGKKGISPKRSIEFAKNLKLPEWQVQYFCDLVAMEHAKSPVIRSEAEMRLKGRAQENQVRIINQTAMRALTSWIDLAILELTYLKNFKPSSDWIAKSLGIEKDQAVNSIVRLKAAKLLEKDPTTGKWVDASPLFSSTDGIPSDSIRKFHQTVLQLAQKKLENPDIKSRTVKSVVFSVSDENALKAKRILDEAISKIVALADESPQERENVMCFSSQLFSLTESKKENK
jgi:uncharacterized protein (TIGR02147 family)